VDKTSVIVWSAIVFSYVVLLVLDNPALSNIASVGVVKSEILVVISISGEPFDHVVVVVVVVVVACDVVAVAVVVGCDSGVYSPLTVVGKRASAKINALRTHQTFQNALSNTKMLGKHI